MADNSSNLPEFTVSEISVAVKRTLEGAFERVRVRGEISGFKRAGSGHLYFALKDAEAKLDAVCWRTTAGPAGGRAGGRAGGHRHRAASPAIPAAPPISSSSRAWSWRAKARC